MSLISEILDLFGLSADAAQTASDVRKEGIVPTLLGLAISTIFIAGAVLLAWDDEAPMWRLILGITVGIAGVLLAIVIVEARSRIRKRHTGQPK